MCEEYGKAEQNHLLRSYGREGFSQSGSSPVGSVARIGPNDLVTDDADLLIKMSAVRSPYSKSETYSGTQFDPELNHVFSERDEARHLELRRKLTPGVCDCGGDTAAWRLIHSHPTVFRKRKHSPGAER